MVVNPLFNAQNKAGLILSCIKCLTVFMAVFILTGCDLTQNTLQTDRDGNLSMQDFRDTLAPREPDIDELEDFAENNVPSLDPFIARSTARMKPMPLVSVSVNSSVPLRDVLYELAEQADYDLELDPNIRGSIIFRVTNRPFDQVVERIADIAGLRYTFDDDVLRMELDTPYNKVYKIDYLNYIRTSSGAIRNNIAVVSGEEADTGSQFEASIESEADFWAELEANISQIIGNARNGTLRTSADPRISVADQNANVEAVAPNGNGISPPDAILRVDSLPVNDGGNDFGGGGFNGEGNGNTFALNRQGGLISLFAPQSVHDDVEEYLKLLKKSITSQVLIEAKILEVTLLDEYAAGIDWRAVNLLSGEGVLQFGTSDPVASGVGSFGTVLPPQTPDDFLVSRPTVGSATNSNFVVGFLGNDIQALVQAIEGFGSVRALASPRVTVLNNQSAVMNIATNQVFFELDIDSTTDEGVTQIDIDSEIRNVPEGVLVNVIPSIDLDSRTISLAVRPTITRIVGQESDPAVGLLTGGTIQSFIPELNVQEIDTIIKANSGQPIVMGGLLQDRIETSEEAVPVLGEVPVMGNFFKSQQDSISKTELVILLKATIIEGNDTIHSTDKDLYRRFSGDRRPFRL